jgi:orotidine-5'-phosphate decarboxylase
VSTPEPFFVTLVQQCEALGRICVGIDPHKETLEKWGLGDSVQDVERFSRDLVAA